MANRFAALDAALLNALATGPKHSRQLHQIDAVVQADLATPRAWNALTAIQSRLQALRRAGRISHTATKGWRITKEAS